MKRGQVYSSGYIKAQDLIDQGKTDGITLTIVKVHTEEMDDGKSQRVLSFAEDDRDLGLNKTNWDTIAEMTKKDDDDFWIGTKICVYPHKLDRPYNGKTHGIRVRGTNGTAAPATNGNGHAPAAVTPQTDLAALQAARKAAADAMRTAHAGKPTEELNKLWLDTIATMFAGKKQAELFPADWNAIAASFTAPAAAIADDDIPF